MDKLLASQIIKANARLDEVMSGSGGGGDVDLTGVDRWEDITNRVSPPVFTSTYSEHRLLSSYVANRTIRLTYTNISIRYDDNRTKLISYTTTEHQMVIKFRDIIKVDEDASSVSVESRFEMPFVRDISNTGSGRETYEGVGRCDYYVGSPPQHRFNIVFGYDIPYPELLTLNATPRVIKIERLINE